MFNETEMEDFLKVLEQTIKGMLVYYKLYPATVESVSDYAKVGRVRVDCVFLGASEEDDTGAGASDVTNYQSVNALVMGNTRGYISPKVGDRGILFFANASSDDPRFIPDSVIGLVDKDLEEQVKYTLISTRESGSVITVEEKEGFVIESKSDKGAKSDVSAMVLGGKLKEILDYVFDMYLKDIYNRLKVLNEIVVGHKHPTATPGPPSVLLPPEAVKITTQIQGIGDKLGDIGSKKSDYSKDGNLLSTTNRNN